MEAYITSHNAHKVVTRNNIKDINLKYLVKIDLGNLRPNLMNLSGG